jgi:hypothetical protein
VQYLKKLILLLTVLLFGWQADFENDKLGVYTKQEWKKDFPNAKGYKSSGIEQKRVYIEKNRSKVLCVYFEKGKSHNGGAKWKMPFKKTNKLTLEYDFYFQKDFNFNKGGKLPGIGAYEAPTGGKNYKKGYSLRFMWYSKGTKGSIKDTNKANLYLYAYVPDKKTKYGLNIPLNTLIIPGKWYHLKLKIDKNNVKVWVNNQLKLNKEFNLTYPADKFLFHTFFGGHTKEWASNKRQKVCFDNFMIIR